MKADAALGFPFPYVLCGEDRPLSTLDRDDLRLSVRRYGAVVLRGFSQVNVDTFKGLAAGVCDGLMRYWLSPRPCHSEDDLVQGVDPGNRPLFPHSEMAYM